MTPADLRRLIEAATKNGERDWYVEVERLQGFISLRCLDNDGLTGQIDEKLGEGENADYQLALYELIAALLNAAPDILALLEAAVEWTEAEAVADAACDDDDVDPEHFGKAVARTQIAAGRVRAAVRRMRGE